MVSSPGIDRQLFTEEHYLRYIGEDVDVSLYKARNGEKMITGQLVSYESGNVTIKRDDEDIKLEVREIAKTRLTVKI